MKALQLLTIITLAAIVSGCCACRRGGSSVPLVNTTWRLSQLGDSPVAGSRGTESFTLTLSDDGRASGTGDCNRYSGTYTLGAGAGAKSGTGSGSGASSGRLAFGSDMVSTRMMCPGTETETRYMEMLRQVDGYTIDGARLMLLTERNVVAIFDI